MSSWRALPTVWTSIIMKQPIGSDSTLTDMIITDVTQIQLHLGEYTHAGNVYNALSEAAFMTGLERNADRQRMKSYAPAGRR